MSVEIIYLHHSGFAVTTDKHLLVFDYYQDPAGVMPGLLQQGKQTWIFSSHQHADHFNPAIRKWQQAAAGYILSDDIRAVGGLKKVSQDKLHYIGPYETKTAGELRITTYGSTDEGVSFAVEADGWRLFHAGDLNWWHWKGDTPDNLRLADEGFLNEMARLEGSKFDVAFFPVDSRLEEYRTMGIEEFDRRVTVEQFVTMHSCGQVWTPPSNFPGNNKSAAVWCPVTAGERLVRDKA